MPLLPELLAPAGDMERLETCLLYGADAIYLGGRGRNLRAACAGFSFAELELAVRKAERADARIYYCLNSFPLEEDLAGLPAVIEKAASANVHGFIVADPGVLRLVLRHAPGVEVHLSTQANTTNSAAVAFWADQGASRVNLARELNWREMEAIRAACPQVELETFAHGAMCLALSGQCLLSAWLNNRPANQGRCTQPCRFEYKAVDSEYGRGPDANTVGTAITVEEQTRPGEALWRVEQGERHSSFWAPHDLCLLPWLPWFVQTGIRSLKIEGRMKGSAYLAHVIDAYRHALDRVDFSASREQTDSEPAPRMFAQDGEILASCMAELFYSASRPLSSGFFLPGVRRNFSEEAIARSGATPASCRSGESKIPDMGHRLLARVLEPASRAAWHIEVRGNWRRDQDVEILLPGLRRPLLTGGAYGLENQRGELADILGSGIRGILYADVEDMVPGVFIRSA